MFFMNFKGKKTPNWEDFTQSGLNHQKKIKNQIEKKNLKILHI